METENKSVKNELAPVAGQTPDVSDMSELMKAHLNEVAGGLAGHSSWQSIKALEVGAK